MTSLLAHPSPEGGQTAVMLAHQKAIEDARYHPLAAVAAAEEMCLLVHAKLA